MESVRDVLNWYKENKPAIPMIHEFATFFFTIPASQIENERNFSLAGVIGRSRRASLTVKNLSMLVFINKNREISEAVKNLEKMNIFEADTADLDEEIEYIEQYLEQSGDLDELNDLTDSESKS